MSLLLCRSWPMDKVRNKVVRYPLHLPQPQQKRNIPLIVLRLQSSENQKFSTQLDMNIMCELKKQQRRNKRFWKNFPSHNIQTLLTLATSVCQRKGRIGECVTASSVGSDIRKVDDKRLQETINFFACWQFAHLPPVGRLLTLFLRRRHYVLALPYDL